MSGPQRVVVIGGVAAGMSAASQVRRRRPEAHVIVFEQGSHISYGACGMPYILEDPGRSMDEVVVLTPEEARDERGIDLRLRHQVVGIDLAGGAVQVRDVAAGTESSEPFDALVYATGAEPVRLPLPGFDLPGVLPLRDFDDGSRLAASLGADVRRAVVVGGGYIGMEMAHVLTARGIAVTVVEKLPQILPGWHAETVREVTAELERHGVEVRAGAAVEGAEKGREGRVAAVTVDGERIETDLVLVAAGIRPRVSLARAAGLRLGDSGALWVNQHQRTSHDAVWAAGDCAEAYHRVLRRNVWIPLGTTANKQGRIAGANAAGFSERFRGIVGTAGFLTFELEVARAGLGPAEAAAEGFEPVHVVVRQRSRAHSYTAGAPVQVLLVADGPTGLLLGAEIVGRDGAALRINPIAAALAAHHSVADLQSYDLVYAPPFAPVWDPLLVAANQLSNRVGSRR